jgi:hypothetical protein
MAFNYQIMMVEVSLSKRYFSSPKAYNILAGCAAIYIDPSVRSNFDFAGLLK